MFRARRWCYCYRYRVAWASLTYVPLVTSATISNQSCPWPKTCRYVRPRRYSRRRTLKSVKIKIFQWVGQPATSKSPGNITQLRNHTKIPLCQLFSHPWMPRVCVQGTSEPVWQRHVLTQPLKSSLAHYAYDRWSCSNTLASKHLTIPTAEQAFKCI